MQRLPRFTVYLLLSERGEVYTGYTTNLCRRFKEHNDPGNRGWTRQRRWHLLATKCFFDRDTALLFEKQLKTSRYDKRNWITRSHRVSGRLRNLCDRYDIQSPYQR